MYPLESNIQWIEYKLVDEITESGFTYATGRYSDQEDLKALQKLIKSAEKIEYPDTATSLGLLNLHLENNDQLAIYLIYDQSKHQYYNLIYIDGVQYSVNSSLSQLLDKWKNL